MSTILVDKIFEIFSNRTQYPVTELAYTNNFTLTVAVILSAQATDLSVNKATKNLFSLYDTPLKFLELGEEGLKKYIRTIGLYNSKSKNIIALSKILVDKYNSEVPSDFDELIKLPGIGRKTANVILNCAFNRPTIAVDTHVYRVARRIGLSEAKNPKKVESELNKLIPEKWKNGAHNWLVLHGRYICKARTPLCESCIINAYCRYFKNINKVKS